MIPGRTDSFEMPDDGCTTSGAGTTTTPEQVLAEVHDTLYFVGQKVTAHGVDAYAVARLVYAVGRLADLLDGAVFSKGKP